MIYGIAYILICSATAGYFVVMEDQDEVAIWLGIFWPLSISAYVGIIIARLLKKRFAHD